MLCDVDVRRGEWGRPNDAGGERVGASTATDLAYLAYSCSSQSPIHTAPIPAVLTDGCASPIIGIAGLQQLVAVVARLHAATPARIAGEGEAAPCPTPSPSSVPPAHGSPRPTAVGATPSAEPRPVALAAQPDAGAPSGRGGSA